MAADWCHNCHFHRELGDGVHCNWCLEFFYRNRRLPLPGEELPTVLESMWAEIDAIPDG